MSRIVNNTITPFLTLFIKVIFEDGTDTMKTFTVNDKVTDFRYVCDKQIEKITGRVANIIPKINTVKRFYTNASKLRSYFEFDVTPEIIVIDASKEFNSNLQNIPVKEILEDEGIENVDRIKTWLAYGFDDEVLLSDNTVNTFSLEEGQYVKDLEYLSKGDEAYLSGRLVAITYNKKLMPESLKFNVDGKIKSINVNLVKSIGEAISPVTPYDSINDALTSIEDTLQLGIGEFTEELTLSKSVTLMGNKAGLSASKTTRDKIKFANETVLSGKITINGNVDVVLDGLVLTKDAILELGKANSVIIKNCIFSGITPNEDLNRKEVFGIRTESSDPMLVQVSGCYFGNPGGRDIYNLFQLRCRLKDGSFFNNNYFSENSCSHNHINIYNVAEGATIDIKNNIWEVSKNAIRLGTGYNPQYILNIVGNTYNATDTDEEYAGILLIQPAEYTTSWSNAVINIDKTIHKDNLQLFYLYSSGGKYLLFNKNNLPVVKINGKVQNLEKYVSEEDDEEETDPDTPTTTDPGSDQPKEDDPISHPETGEEKKDEETGTDTPVTPDPTIPSFGESDEVLD